MIVKQILSLSRSHFKCKILSFQMRADTSSDKVFKVIVKFKFLAQNELEISLF